MLLFRELVALSLLSLAAIVWGGCQLVGGYENFERSEPAKTKPESHECDALPRSATRHHGPVLLLIDDPDRSCFWMDKTEVTVADYQLWVDSLAGNAPDWSDIDVCAWKSDAKPFDPDQPVADCKPQNQPLFSPDPFDDAQPIRCVDWCEAQAYCHWAGKRLCSVISSDEWQIACSVGYTQTHPLDPSVPEPACNYGQDCASGCGPVPADQDETCRPAAGSPLNLGGNVEEWIDQCFPGANGVTSCVARGGSYLSSRAQLTCSNTNGYYAISERQPMVGFRCCASLNAVEESAVVPN